MYSAHKIIVILAIGLVMVGCSRSGSPILLGDQSLPKSNVGSIAVGVSEQLSDGTPLEGMGALGLFELRIDPSKTTAELVSLRSSALTDVLEEVDITNFLRLAPCSDCVKLRAVGTNADGDVVLSIGIRHPFATGDPLKPITGRNRADLHVFNVEGIVISNRTGVNFPGVDQTVADFNLTNADGYTGYLDNCLDSIYPTDATIHPYILHFDDYSAGNFSPTNAMGFASVTTPPPSGNLVMAMGCDFDYKDYVFKINPAEPVSFIYAVGCTYALSAASMSERFTPEYRIPQHNKKAASEVSVSIIDNQLESANPNSSAEIEIHVVDISQGVAIGTGLGEMLSDSSVGAITMDVPGVLSSPIIVDISSPTGSGHSSSDPLIYHATITNEASATEGIYRGLVKVVDTYYPGQNTTSTLFGMDGIKRVGPIENPLTGLFAITEFASYAVFYVDVETGNLPPVAVLEPDPASCNQGDSIDFDGTGSTDSDGTIVLYEFDFEWDGIEANFTSDASNATGLATSSIYNTDGMYTAGLRVTDNLGAVDYDSVEVTVTPVTAIYVDNSYTGSTSDGTMAYPYKTINEGITNATTGYPVIVDDSGTPYTEQVMMKTGISVVSENWDTSDGTNRAFIDPPDDPATYPVVFTEVSNSSISGFKLGFGGIVTVYSYMVNVSGGTDNTIEDCYFTGINSTARYVYCINATGTTNLIVQNCKFADIDGTAGYVRNVRGVYATNSPGTKVLNCVFANLRPTSDGTARNIDVVYIQSSNDITVKNNLLYHIVPHAPDNSNFMYGLRFVTVDNLVCQNNTMDELDVRDGFMIQQVFGYWLEICSNVTFSNNIGTRIYSNGFPPPLARGVQGVTNPVTCYYSCMFDILSLYFGTATPDVATCISVDPMYISPSTGNFDLNSASLAQAGDISFLDWDDDNSGGYESRSRMGCNGGPGGEKVGLLTPE